MSLVIERLGLDMDRHAALSQSVLDRYNQHATSHTRLYPGVRDALEQLASAGHSLGVCTNKPEEPARSVVQHLDLGPFECIVGGDTFPERKPQPGPLKATFAALKGGPMLFVGDSGYSDDFKTIAERLGTVDVALVPIGAYDPRWIMKSSHMTPEEAAQVVQDVGANRAIGMHWGTFALTNEPMAEPAERASATGVIETPKPGQLINLIGG